jgi:CHRD domain-containing protein/centrosomal CEP192-like protein
MRRVTRIILAALAAATVVMVVASVGQAGGPPSLEWSPSTGGSFDYGVVAVGHDSSQTFTLTNSGGSASAKLTVALSGSGSFTITADNCVSLGPGKSCSVTVSYAPTLSAGPETATLSANGKKDTATADLTLTGRGVLVFVATGPNAPSLSPLNENPPHPSSSASGTATVTWDVAANTMEVDVQFSGLSGPDTASHIHCCVASPGNTGVATTLPTFTGFPTGVTSGTYSHTFDMLDPASYNPAFVTAHGGTAASAEAALLTGIEAGQAYLNIHSTVFPGGEERGLLQQS